MIDYTPEETNPQAEYAKKKLGITPVKPDRNVGSSPVPELKQAPESGVSLDKYLDKIKSDNPLTYTLKKHASEVGTLIKDLAEPVSYALSAGKTGAFGMPLEEPEQRQKNIQKTLEEQGNKLESVGETASVAKFERDNPTTAKVASTVAKAPVEVARMAPYFVPELQAPYIAYNAVKSGQATEGNVPDKVMGALKSGAEEVATLAGFGRAAKIGSGGAKAFAQRASGLAAVSTAAEQYQKAQQGQPIDFKDTAETFLSNLPAGVAFALPKAPIDKKVGKFNKDIAREVEKSKLGKQANEQAAIDEMANTVKDVVADVSYGRTKIPEGAVPSIDVEGIKQKYGVGAKQIPETKAEVVDIAQYKLPEVAKPKAPEYEQPMAGGIAKGTPGAPEWSKSSQTFWNKVNQKPDKVEQGPLIRLNEDVTVKDIHGNKTTFKKGHELRTTMLEGQVLAQDGNDAAMPKNQFEALKSKSVELGEKSAIKMPEDVDIIKSGGVDWRKAQDELTEALKKQGFSRQEIEDISDTWGRGGKELAFQYAPKEAEKVMASSSESTPTKFSQHIKNRGDNYKETRVVVPHKIGSFAEYLKSKGVDANKISGQTEYQKSLMDEYDTLKKEQNNSLFKSSHWNEPNVVTHILSSEYQTPKGDKVFNINETQSDWEKEGRRAGFIKSESPQIEVIRQITPNSWKLSIEGRESTWTAPTLEEAKQKMLEGWNRNQSLGGVPYHPHVEKWLDISLTQALKDAVESDAKYLSWDDGQTVKDRYDLSRVVDRITIVPRTDARTGDVSRAITLDLSGNMVPSYIEFGVNNDGMIDNSTKSDFMGKPLSEAIGKDLAEKIMSEEPKPTTLEGPDLKFGGEWADHLYNRVIPKKLKEMTKKLGGMIVEVEIGEKETDPQNMQKYRETGNESYLRGKLKQALLITPAIRQAVQGGLQPMAGGKSRKMPEKESPLHAEARKYKSAEEFSNAMMYHGTLKDNVPKILEEGLIGSKGRIGKYKGNKVSYVSFANDPNKALNFASGRGGSAGMVIAPKPSKIYDLGDIRARAKKTPEAIEFINKFGDNELYWGKPEAKKWLADKGYEAVSFMNPDGIVEIRVLGNVKNVFNVPEGFIVTKQAEFMGKPVEHFSINKEALTSIWNEANKGKELKPFEFQNTKQEKIIHNGKWDVYNPIRHDLEGAGDIFRELSKEGYNSFDYINEKIKRLDRLFERYQKNDVLEGESISGAWEGVPEYMKALKKFWQEQPTTTPEQLLAKNLNLELLKGNIDSAKGILKQLKGLKKENGKLVLPTKSVGAAGKSLPEDKIPLDLGTKTIKVRDPNGKEIEITPKEGEQFYISQIATKDGKVKYELHDGTTEDISRNSAKKLVNKFAGVGEIKSTTVIGTGPQKRGTLVSDVIVEGEEVPRPSFRVDKINAPEDVVNILKSMAAEAGEFKEQRPTGSLKELERLAKESKISVDELLDVPPRSIMSAPDIIQANKLRVALAKDLADYSKSIDTATATPQELNTLKEKYVRLMGVSKTLAGMRTEASNIFRALQIETPYESEVMKELLDNLKVINKDAANDMLKFAKDVRELSEPTIADKLLHLWYASILSGPSTHLKNIIGNLSQLSLEVARIATTNPSQLPQAIMGIAHSFVPATKGMASILKSGAPSKFEARGIKPIVFRGIFRPLNAADYVGRALEGMDTFFKGLTGGMELHQVAFLKAKSEGLKGRALKDKMKFYIKNPTPEMLEKVEEYKRYMTYQQKPEGVLGTLAGALGRASNKHPSMKMIVPFTNVVANVTNNAIDWTPWGLVRFARQYKKAKTGKDFLGRPADSHSTRRRQQDLGRAIMGTLAMAALAALAANDKMTGKGPSDYSKKQQLMASGWKPHSFVFTDKQGNKTYVPYTHYLGPLALNAGIVANFHDALKYSDLDEKSALERTSVALLGTGNLVLDMSFLNGISELLSALNDPDIKGPSYLKRVTAQTVSSAYPNLFKQIDRYFDPTVYDSQDITEAIQNSMRITDGLRPKIDIFGDPVKGERLTGLEPSKQKKDDIKTYLADNSLWISVPNKNTKILDSKTDELREMTPKEYYDYVKLSGERIKSDIANEIDVIQYEETSEDKQNYINDIVRAAREDALIDLENK